MPWMPFRRQPGAAALSPRNIHALNNYIGVIVGYLELWLDETPEDDLRRKDLLQMRDAAKSAAALLKQVAEANDRA